MKAGRALAAVLLALTVQGLTASRQAATAFPDRLTDSQFWSLTQNLSEPGGTFASDNLVSNELGFQRVLPALTDRHPPGGVYLGVGPEQNFTYIAALEPRIAFILDIRRGNRDLHLMYKALFDIAADRAEFVSLLFSRARPDGVTRQSTAAELFAAYERVEATEEQFRANLARVTDRLVNVHGWPLAEDERRGIEGVYRSFFQFGPAIGYTRVQGVQPSGLQMAMRMSYADLAQATDAKDELRGYLSSEARFTVVKALQSRNLVVPVVGNFAGPTALRAIGTWLRERGGVVSVFYVSNVEDYLRRDGAMATFCQNVATLPLDDRSDFIRSGGLIAVPSVPTPTSPTLRFISRADGAVITMIYSDGTQRQLTDAEAAVELKKIMGRTANRLGSMVEETRICGRGSQPGLAP